MKTKNIEKQAVNAKTAEKAVSRRNVKIGRFEAKEMKQVTNDKTLAKHLSSTRQKLVNLQHCDDIDTTAALIKHINFCEKHRKTSLVEFDAKAIKEVAKYVDLQQFCDERGFNQVSALTYCIGILDKQRKELIKKQQKATEKENSKESK